MIKNKKRFINYVKDNIQLIAKYAHEQEKIMFYFLQRLFCIQANEAHDGGYSQTEIGEGYTAKEFE